MTLIGTSRIAALILQLAFAPAAILAAEAPAEPEGDTIGLVLAGGGARGGAHVGVLKVMEELRVPVDRIAGTSMGSIVGALYAVGYSPEEMAETLSAIDWESVFRDLPDRKYLSYRQKEDDLAALMPFEIGVGRNGISTRSGIIVGTKIEFLFRQLTIEAARARNFDELRIPYRAVAADLETGDAVVLDRGDLALAMRTSMSIPGVFTPVKLNGHLLVDGGIANNMPVDVARSMGADRIIAIDVGTPPKGSAEGLSSLGVLSQTLAVTTEKNVIEQRASIGPQDLLITPELEGIGAGDFPDVAAAIAAGEKAARQYEAELRRFSVSEEEYAAFLKRQRRNPKDAPEIIVDEIAVEGLPTLDSSVVTRRMLTKKGEPLDFDKLARDLVKLNQLGDFASVGFRLEPIGEKNRLVVEARPKPWGPGYVRFGVGLETVFDGEADFRLLGQYRRPQVNRLGGEIKTWVSLGEPTGLHGEFYQPIVPTGTFFVAPRASAWRLKDDFFLDDGTREAVQTRRWDVGADFGVQFRNWAELRVGLDTGQVDFDPQTTATLEEISRDTGGARVLFTLDQIDNVFFPTRGNLTRVYGYFSRDGYGAEDVYDSLFVSTFQAVSWGRNTFVGWAEYKTDLGSDLPTYAEFKLGGFLKLSGFKNGELRGSATGLLSLGDYWRIGRLGPLGSLYFGAVAQGGNAWDDPSDAALDDLLYSGTLFFGVDNRFAPLYLGYGHAEGGESETYLFVGRWF